MNWRGLTGRIELKEGRRVQFKLDLIRLKQHSIVKVGEWTPDNRVNIIDRSGFFDASPMNVTPYLHAITILVSSFISRLTLEIYLHSLNSGSSICDDALF